MELRKKNKQTKTPPIFALTQWSSLSYPMKFKGFLGMTVLFFTSFYFHFLGEKTRMQGLRGLQLFEARLLLEAHMNKPIS